MSDTPRTDAIAFIPMWKDMVVNADDYRELERELAKIHLDSAQLRSDLTAARYEINRLRLLHTGSLSDKELAEWKAKAEANERDAERWRQFMSSVSYWREPLVNAATGEEVGDECLYRISWRGRPFATLENSVDAARSAEKESK